MGFQLAPCFRAEAVGESSARGRNLVDELDRVHLRGYELRLGQPSRELGPSRAGSGAGEGGEDYEQGETEAQ